MRAWWGLVGIVGVAGAWFLLKPLLPLPLGSIKSLVAPKSYVDANDALVYYRIIGQVFSVLISFIGLAIGFAYYLDHRARRNIERRSDHVYSMRSIALDRLDKYDDVVNRAASIHSRDADQLRDLRAECVVAFDRLQDMLDVPDLLGFSEAAISDLLDVNSIVDKSDTLFSPIVKESEARFSAELDSYHRRMRVARKHFFARPKL